MRQIRLDIGKNSLKSVNTTEGRKYGRKDDDNCIFSITPYSLDKIKILQSKGLRRLAEKK